MRRRRRYLRASNGPFDFRAIREAQEFLDSIDQDKVELVEECRDAILDLYADPYEGSPYRQEQYVIRDYKSTAAEEWLDLDIEDADVLFDGILDALDIIYADEAAAWT